MSQRRRPAVRQGVRGRLVLLQIVAVEVVGSTAKAAVSRRDSARSAVRQGIKPRASNRTVNSIDAAMITGIEASNPTAMLNLGRWRVAAITRAWPGYRILDAT